jgi:hypothetical protein
MPVNRKNRPQPSKVAGDLFAVRITTGNIDAYQLFFTGLCAEHIACDWRTQYY